MVLNLVHSFEGAIANQTLAAVYASLSGDAPADIPFWVWLLENPASPIALPGNIDLQTHDYLHILLGRGQSSQDEAFVVGFTMGNDPDTRPWHVALFKYFARYLYPQPYQLSAAEIKIFDLGFDYGRRLPAQQLNRLNFEPYLEEPVAAIRQQFGIDPQEIRLLRHFETWLLPNSETSQTIGLTPCQL